MPKFSRSFVEFTDFKFADTFDRRLAGVEVSAVISVSEPISSIDNKFGPDILEAMNKKIPASDLSSSDWVNS